MTGNSCTTLRDLEAADSDWLRIRQRASSGCSSSNVFTGPDASNVSAQHFLNAGRIDGQTAGTPDATAFQALAVHIGQSRWRLIGDIRNLLSAHGQYSFVAVGLHDL